MGETELRAQGDFCDEPEEWHPIEGWPDYQVSNLGHVLSARPWPRGNRPARILKPWDLRTKAGIYPAVTLYGATGVRKYLLHRLVCEAFHGAAPSPRHEVAHWDGDTQNARAKNLRWATPTENCADKERHGTKLVGEDLPWAMLTVDAVRELRKSAADGVADADLAQRFSISLGHARAIRRNNAWIWLSKQDGAAPIKRPRPSGVRHHRNKLTAAQVLDIYRLPHANQKALAEQYGVTQSVISHIQTRRIWRHLTEGVEK